jgi:thioredoxin-dependent peroxiredoxin
MLKRGDVAPDFAVGGRTLYQILEERSAVVFFYPKAFTPGCTREAGGFRREHENLQASGCEVIGVSRDPQETSDRFRESLGLPFSLVGDPGEGIIRGYDVRWPIVGLTQRVTYVIGRNRKVRVAFHSELNMDAHSAQACQVLADKAPSA